MPQLAMPIGQVMVHCLAAKYILSSDSMVPISSSRVNGYVSIFVKNHCFTQSPVQLLDDTLLPKLKVKLMLLPSLVIFPIGLLSAFEPITN